ncbi:hypothetical protein [Leptospira kanakyensis]|uniref:hypothetical protein n=1 Tax=Leptospira kanakyensis TaxID=2484968 RepID=UPI00223CD8AF|nr:hypothetical protein [Leptospira kanakyensis]MCW7480174.1 hypothetical protein [Leptospira kanakyensis]
MLISLKRNIIFLANFKFIFPFVFFIHCHHLYNGPDYIEGSEANQRITSPIISKLHSCSLLTHSYNRNDTNPDPMRRTLSIETTNSFFLILHLFTRFEVFNPYSYYKTKDIDRCSKDIEFYSCDHFSPRWSNDANFGFFIATIVCNDVKTYDPPLQRIFPSSDEEESEEE